MLVGLVASTSPKPRPSPRLSSSQHTPGCVAPASMNHEFGPRMLAWPPQSQGHSSGAAAGGGGAGAAMGAGAGGGAGAGSSLIVSAPLVTSNTTRRFAPQASSQGLVSSGSLSLH